MKISHFVSSCVLPDTFVLVYSIFFLETVQTALSGADLYHWFAAGFGNLSYLISAYLSFFDVPIMGSMVSLSVQFYFAYRIFVLGAKRSWWLCVIICLVSLPQKVPEQPYHYSHSSLLSAHSGHSHWVYRWVFSASHYTELVSITVDIPSGCIYRRHEQKEPYDGKTSKE